MQVMFGVLGNEILHKGDYSQSHFATRQSIIPPLDVPFHDLQSHLRIEDHLTRASMRSILLLLSSRPPALDTDDPICRGYSRLHHTFKRHAKDVGHPGE
jgi:hypothetical protein